MIGISSPPEGRESFTLEERRVGPERASRMTTRDEDLERQAKNVGNF